MKKLALLVAFVGLGAVGYGSDYGSAYGDGYEQGYRYAGRESKGYDPITPIRPIDPLPKFGEYSEEDRYNRGIIEGYREYQKEKRPWE